MTFKDRDKKGLTPAERYIWEQLGIDPDKEIEKKTEETPE